jgi:hypothetical protein
VYLAPLAQQPDMLCCCRALSEADQSLDSGMGVDDEDYAVEPARLRCSSRQRRARKWGDDECMDWGAPKSTQSDDYSDEGMLRCSLIEMLCL